MAESPLVRQSVYKNARLRLFSVRHLFDHHVWFDHILTMSTDSPSTHSPSQPSLSGGTYQRWLRFRTRLSTGLWTMFAVAVLAISVARIPWLSPNGLKLNQLRGEYCHYRLPFNKALLWTHLASVIPSGLLAA
ncbi:hypothetical protein FRC12_018040, partial [Ceratobasidium sp. 428]